MLLKNDTIITTSSEYLFIFRDLEDLDLKQEPINYCGFENGSCSTSAIHCIHTLNHCSMTHRLHGCHFLISIYISPLLSGNILQRLDLQLGGALRQAFVYCTTLGQCSGMQNRRGRHTVEAISQTIPVRSPVFKPKFSSSILHDACVNTSQANQHHLAPAHLLYVAEYQETCSF